MGLRLKKKNKKKKYYLLFLILIYFSSFFFTVKMHCSNKNQTKFIRYLLENNSNYINNKEDKRIVTKVVSYIANVNLKKPTTLINNNYKVDKPKENSAADQNIDILPASNHIKDPYPEKNINEPIVYLYNTHQGEEYALSNNEIYNIKPTVMTLSYILREKLNKNEIATIVEENDVLEVLRVNNWNYASSYKVTRMMLDSAKQNNNSLRYFVDLHRDSVNKKISTITIDNINYAKVLFIVGLENPNYESNLALTEKLNNMINNKYPNLSRGIYKKKGKGVNGVYNQDFDPNTILIEVGGSDNTIDEVYNTAEVIAQILTEYIRNDLNE